MPEPGREPTGKQDNVNKLLPNLLAGILLAGLGVWVWVYTESFPTLQEGYPGPALFPRVIAAGLALAGVGFIGSSLRRMGEIQRAPGRLAWAGVARLALGVGLVALYPVMQTWLGFIPAISILCFVVAVALKVRWIVAAVVAVAGTLLLYGLFTGVLGVPLS